MGTGYAPIRAMSSLRLAAFFLPLAFASSAAAQSTPAEDQPRTLLDTSPNLDHSGWFIGPTFDVTTIDRELEASGGVRGAWLINRKFGVGLAFTGLESDSRSDDDIGRKIEGGWGGLLLQYIIRSKSVVHGFADITIGGGGACIDIEGDDTSSCKEGRGFFAVEPTANVEINVLSFMRISFGGGYRLVVGPDATHVPSSDLSGMVVRSTIAFGEF